MKSDHLLVSVTEHGGTYRLPHRSDPSFRPNRSGESLKQTQRFTELDLWREALRFHFCSTYQSTHGAFGAEETFQPQISVWPL